MDVAIAYNPLLVLLSIAIAVQASYVGLRLTIQVADAKGLHRRLLLVGASLSLAMGIWGMHFVGMLAIALPVGTTYQVLPTLMSFLLCVLVVGFAIVGASLWPTSFRTLACTASVMGVGIATMHYIGMMALHDSLHMVHDRRFVVASLLAAVLASATALWLATMARRRPSLIVCAIVLGLAISSMHYIAMAGTTIHQMGHIDNPGEPSLSSGLMAIVVAVVAFIVSAGFFLTLVPEPRAFAVPSKAEMHPHAATPLTEATAQAEATPLSQPLPPAEPEHDPDAVPDLVPKQIPVERDGARIMLPPHDVYAVRANAHYCSIYNGREELFCSLSISDVEACLGGTPFVRVHRSHIVNLDRVVAVRKIADGGFADLSGHPKLSIPISRTKINAIRDCVTSRHPSASVARTTLE
ncbi:MHYT domain-containing protein [Lichenihabitans psoromatis]|uniref:MHYT domain-containing protein n=1 Tax=Lichenihabitans psoromatis TaxID=2528642 RepID=UPI001038325B|nr:MHYT domain-containing protein [Lichenihabitans psoromatis]